MTTTDSTYQDASPATPPKGFKPKVSNDNGEAVQHVNVDASAVTGGTILDEDYAASGSTRSSIAKSLAGKVALATNWASTSGDILTIAAIRTSNTNASTNAALKWIEIR